MLVFIMARNYVRRLCFAALRMKSALMIDGAVGVVQVGGLLLLAWTGRLTADRAYWIMGAACGIATLVWLVGNRRSFVVRLDQTRADFAWNWSLGKWVLAGGLFWDLGMNLYPWILGGFHGAEAIGVWAACLGVVSMGNPAFLGMQNYLGPQIVHCRAEGGNHALYRFVMQATATFCGVVLVFSLFLLVFGDWLLVFLYGEKYAGNSLVLYAMAMNLVVSAAMFLLSRGLLALERADVDFIINTAAIVLLLSAGLWLVRSWGVCGAAVGILLTNSLIVAAKYTAFVSLCGPERSAAA
jgi:O-antigen/teichoic acid export membrane protein